MSFFVLIALLVLCVAASAILSGSETGLYSISRTRLDAELRAGIGRSRLIELFLRDDARLLITLLLGTALVDQIATTIGLELLAPLNLPQSAHEIIVAIALTPPLLFFGGVLPKDLFRRRPHTLVGWCAPLLAALSVCVAPLAIPLRLFTGALFRAFGLQEHELVRVGGREAVIELLRERDAELSPELEAMARKVLELRSIAIERVMVPWKKVETLRADGDARTTRGQAERSGFSRWPVVESGGAVVGYVHQLEFLAADERALPREHLRPMLALPPGLSIDRALIRLRKSGQRAAVVGTLARPIGLVTLKDLLEEISGELYRW